MVALEGPRALDTALDHGAELLFALRESGPAEGARRRFLDRVHALGVEVVEVPRATFSALASTESPLGILALAREPGAELPDRPATRPPRILVLDRVQEPGNVGVLIRAAAAFGLERVLLLDGTADPWSSKAVRASAGLSFALPLHPVSWASGRDWLAGAGVPLLVADGAGEDVRSWLNGRGSPDPGWALLVGNEGAGARPEARREARATRVAIPVAEGVESLNVASAGAILLWALGPGCTR